MSSVKTHKKLAGFDLIQTNYKQIKDHPIRVDFIIPKSPFTGKRPVIVRFHGGGLMTGDSLSMEWFPKWLLQLAKTHNAVIVSPNYCLMPESTSPEIFSDVEDFWEWLHSAAVPELLATSPNPISLDLNRILMAGESAGGLLSICLAFEHADEIRAATASYPPVGMASEYFSTPNPKPLPGIPPSTVDDYLARMDPSAVRSSAIPPDRFDVIIAAIQYGDLVRVYERGTRDSPCRELRYPLERLDRADVKIPRGGVAILHGLQDAVVPPEQSKKFVAKAREVFKGKPGGDKIFLTLQKGDHGLDCEVSLEEEWLPSHLKEAVKAWLEMDSHL